MAIFFADPALSILKIGVLILFIGAPFVITYFNKMSWKSLVTLGGVFAVLLVWWNTLTPVNKKDWAPESPIPLMAR